jgi:NDP-sugar pyrophosphorylase family protein
VYAYRFAGMWFDIGNPEQLLEADNHWRERVGLQPREAYSPIG